MCLRPAETSFSLVAWMNPSKNSLLTHYATMQLICRQCKDNLQPKLSHIMKKFCFLKVENLMKFYYISENILGQEFSLSLGQPMFQHCHSHPSFWEAVIGADVQCRDGHIGLQCFNVIFASTPFSLPFVKHPDYARPGSGPDPATLDTPWF